MECATDGCANGLKTALYFHEIKISNCNMTLLMMSLLMM